MGNEVDTGLILGLENFIGIESPRTRTGEKAVQMPVLASRKNLYPPTHFPSKQH